MERFYWNTGLVSIYVGREATSDWGACYNGDTVEVWAGRTYVCADFARARIRRLALAAIYVAAVFVVGLYLDPPDFAQAAAHAVQDAVIWALPDSPL